MFVDLARNHTVWSHQSQDSNSRLLVATSIPSPAQYPLPLLCVSITAALSSEGSLHNLQYSVEGGEPQ